MSTMLDRAMTLAQRVVQKIRWVLRRDTNYRQLELFLPPGSKKKIEFSVPDRYCLRLYKDKDRDAVLDLMHRAGFIEWDGETLRQAMDLFIPSGFYLALEKDTGTLVAMMAARHVSDRRHPLGGDIGWLAADSAHAGQGLGYIMTAAVTNRLIEANYGYIYVTTDDFRLPAIKTFTKAGFIPDLYHEEMHGRWESICITLDLPFQPQQWQKRKRELLENLQNSG